MPAVEVTLLPAVPTLISWLPFHLCWPMCSFHFPLLYVHCPKDLPVGYRRQHLSYQILSYQNVFAIHEHNEYRMCSDQLPTNTGKVMQLGTHLRLCYLCSNLRAEEGAVKSVSYEFTHCDSHPNSNCDWNLNHFIVTLVLLNEALISGSCVCHNSTQQRLLVYVSVSISLSPWEIMDFVLFSASGLALRTLLNT